MTTIFKILITAFCAFMFTSCNFDFNLGQVRGNGNVVEENLNISGEFRDIEASSGWDVILKKGDDFSVTAEMDENLLEILDVHVSGNTLEIETKGHDNIGFATSKKVYVTYKDNLENISASSGASVDAVNILEGERMQFDVSSGGSINVEAMVRNIKTEVSSGGNIRIAGGAESFEASVSSGGTIDAKDLKSEDCVAEASSGGNIKVWAGNSINAEASSGGSINYWGNPKIAHTPKSMSGSISKN